MFNNLLEFYHKVIDKIQIKEVVNVFYSLLL